MSRLWFMLAVIAAASDVHAADWKDLFDGETLNGWEVHSGSCSFHVEDGSIVGTVAEMSPNTFLCTSHTFGDFELELEVKCDPALNSGIQIRSEITAEQTAFTFMNKVGKLRTITLPADRVYGYQVEVAKTESGRSGGIYDEARRFYFLDDLSDDARAKTAYREGEWNTFRIRCLGDRIQTWVNDIPCADVRDGLTPRGVIGLQVHGQVAINGRKIYDEFVPRQVRFRSIRVKELSRLTAEN